MRSLKKQKKTKRLNVILFISLSIYSFFGLLFSIYQIDLFRIPQLIGVLLFLIVSWHLLISYLKSSNKRILIAFFLLWQLFILLRINKITSESIRMIFFEPLHFLSYLIPLLIFLPINLNSLKKKFIYLFIFSFSFTALHLFLIFEFPLNNFTDTIVISSLSPVGILLLLSKYVNKKIIFCSFTIVLVILIVGLIYGRRSVVINASMFIMISFLINIFTNKKIKFGIKIISLLLFVLVAFFSINYFISNANENNFEILSRYDTDSRSDVISAFIKDFSFQDYVIGRGVDGSYYDPTKYWNFANDDYREVKNRTNIENGFLYMIMKGGVIYLVSFLIILFNAIYLGFFKSNNLFLKGLASYLFIYLLDMFVYGQPIFSMKYCLVWISISICFSKNFRRLNENQILFFINT